ncbi:Peptidoglycan/LPS O-acetylase OafA/YrhL, contains acyltransferase and SGNH-hydrolase domains [Chryseobacterium soldanellicola]|uniref:Peptidoglycan/LPS O-acetylase OafA/YrhL, contains acyltransferase and SGNH-hydrolase domains n=1 Tax=Chryseobacterium soldanellicola TaxID=311333 RepID=A0A1H1E6D0_9FLAO|nr:acyltransferase [Chryseobacterium soldanellicola]SDQ84335.1 Peptidoglycan/LPS O-acetylase OafA/YrhL, contains acyltransferase and SGNH-hydrolase domains [Chryseobacterium soldanellicola]
MQMQDITKNNFDFIRVLLAFIVFVGHLGTLSASKDLKIFEHSPIEIAVFGFFVVSGFLIARSYERSSSLKSYLKKRILRIVPAYLLVVFLCAILLSLVSKLSFYEYFTNTQVYKYLFWNSLFLNFKAPWLPGVFGNQAVNGALWTLKVEMCYYFCVPLLFLLFGKNNKYRNISLIIIYFLSLIYLNYFESLNKISLAKQIPGVLCYFIPGMLIYFNFDKFIKYKNPLFIVAVITVWIDLIFDIKLISPIMIGVIVLYIAYSFKFLNNFGKYGDFTYGIYIFHFPIIRTFTTLGLFEDYNPFVMALVCMLVVIGVGVSSWHFYEKKFL